MFIYFQKITFQVRAKITDLKANKRTKDMGMASPCDESAVVIIGGGPSGATCAETLRSEGFKGRITIVAKENYLPYDRIKVSKMGTVPDIEKLQVRSKEYYQDAHIDIIKGVEATKLEPDNKLVHLSDGTKLRYSAVYLATGSKPRVPDIPGIDLKNIFTVRNLEDSVNIIRAIGSDKDKDVVVLGLSFIGLEAAASCVGVSKSMTVVGKDSEPLGLIFGPEIGRSLRKLFEDKNVKFHFGTTIAKCNGDGGAIKSVELANGTTLAADVLILGVGTTYYTDFLGDSGVALRPNGSVIVSDRLETNVKGVYAGGDIAYAPVYAHNDEPMSIGHVGLAQYHGKMAGLNILKRDARLKTVPYFWTMVFGKSIRYAGCGRPASTQIEGDVEALKFVMFFFDKSDKVIAVASCMRDPVVSQFAELLFQGRSLYKKDLKDDPFAWTKIVY